MKKVSSVLPGTLIKKIVIIGPESTGKSTLCELLAQHYGTGWCPEFAREYLLTNGMNYSFEDLLTIAKGQIAMEEEYVQLAISSFQPSVSNQKRTGDLLKAETPHSSLITHHSPLFIDTDMYVMKVWCEFVFGKNHKWVTDQIAKRKYDLYLLCNIDLPWVKDELREYPDLERRKKLYSIYKNIMQNQPVPWVEISGNYEERLAKAIEAVNKILLK